MPANNKIKATKWAKIRDEYLAGKKILAIAREYGITDGAIHYRRKIERWDDPKFTALKREIEQHDGVFRVKESKGDEIIKDTVISAPTVKEVVDETPDYYLNQAKHLNFLQNLDKGGLKMHQAVLSDVIKLYNQKQMKPIEVAIILQKMGLSLKDIGQRLGIGNENTTAIQINNSTQEVKIIVEGVSV